MVTADILGSIYERFLGKVITLSPGRRATMVEKPEVRKAGGVYYTPAYIVDYIVSNTVGRLLEGRTPREATGLKVLDPACGSGSFLIGAYQSLLDWYLEQYLARGDAARLVTARKAVLRPTVTGGYALSIAERKRILLDHIHGVDIDSQAVEVTKLNLLLKCLEGQTAVTLGFEQKLFRDRALPDLGQSILCGNSLIGTDIVGSNAWRQMSEQEQVRVNPFDYERSFAQVFNRRERGFDVVIGNPPYGAAFDLHSADCLRARHGDVLRILDSYAIFMLDSRRWLQADGLLSFIVPTGWYSGDHFSLLRQEIIRAFDPLAFVNLPYDIFHDAWVDTTVFVLRLRGMPREFPVSGPLAVSLKSFPKRHKIIKAKEIVEGATVADCARWFQHDKNVFLTYSDDASSVIIEKMMRASSPLSHYADIQRGITPFIYLTKYRGKAHGERAFTGTVRRYALTHGEESWVRYDETLSEYKPQRYFTGRRILLREIISRQFRLQAVIVTEDFITNKSMQSVLVRRAKPGLPFFLGIINSKLLSWYFLQRSNVGQRDDFPKIVLKETRSLPIPIAHAEPSADSPKAKKLSVLTKSMLGLHRRLAAEKHPQRVEQIQREIEAVDRQIDQLVYELYGLTEEEIRIVEESTA